MASPPVTPPVDGNAISPATTVPARESAAAPAAATLLPAAAALLTQLDTDHPALTVLPARERLLAAAWLACYRSARTRRAYALDLTAWLDWLPRSTRTPWMRTRFQLSR